MKLRPVHLVATAAAALVFGAVTVRTIAATGVAQPATNPADKLLRFVGHYTFAEGGGCDMVYRVPLTRSLIIQNITFIIVKSTSDTYGATTLYSDSNCSQFVAQSVSSQVAETINQSNGAGLAIPQGTTLYAKGYNNRFPELALVGYLIQSTDANIEGPNAEIAPSIRATH